MGCQIPRWIAAGVGEVAVAGGAGRRPRGDEGACEHAPDARSWCHFIFGDEGDFCRVAWHQR
jgi:hypothetical protein